MIRSILSKAQIIIRAYICILILLAHLLLVNFVGYDLHYLSQKREIWWVISVIAIVLPCQGNGAIKFSGQTKAKTAQYIYFFLIKKVTTVGTFFSRFSGENNFFTRT